MCPALFSGKECWLVSWTEVGNRAYCNIRAINLPTMYPKLQELKIKQIKFCPSIYLNLQSYNIIILFFIFMRIALMEMIPFQQECGDKQVKLSTRKLRENIRTLKTHDNFSETVTLYTSCFLIKWNFLYTVFWSTNVTWWDAIMSLVRLVVGNVYNIIHMCTKIIN